MFWYISFVATFLWVMQFHIYKPETIVRGDVRIYLHVPLTSCFLCLVIVIGLFTTRKRIFTLQVIEHNMIDCTIQMICTWVRCQIKWPFFHVASCLDRILKVCFGLHKITSSCPKWHGRIMLLCFTVIFRYKKLQMNKTIHTYKTPHSSSAEVRRKIKPHALCHFGNIHLIQWGRCMVAVTVSK